MPGNIFHRSVGIREGSGAPVLSSPEIHPDDWHGTMLFDLRKVGLIPLPTGVLRSIDDWRHPVGDLQRERLSMEPVELEGQTVTQIVMKAGDGDVTRLWIDEARGPSLVRVEHEARPQGKVYLDIHRVTLAETDGVWFPSRVVHERRVNGRPLPAETTDLENVRLNHGVADSLFTLESVGVQPGTLVNVYPQPPEGPQVWDGTAVRPMNPRQQPPEQPANRDNNHFWRDVLVYVNLAAAGVLLVAYIVLRRRERQRH